MFGSFKTILYTFYLFVNKGIPDYILYFGDSLGDNLLLTIIAKELKTRGYNNIWIKSNHFDLFLNNSDISLILPFHTLLSSFVLKLFRVQHLQLKYSQYLPEEDRDIQPDRNVILKFLECLNLKGEIQNLPILNLMENEKTFGKYAINQIAICTSSRTATVPMENKEWYTERYQTIVDLFAEKFTFIQIGSSKDDPLKNVIDLRGKTTIRQSASILYNSLLFVSHEGFLMHLSRAVNCRSVMIYGGRIDPNQIGYSCNSNIYQKEECAPCWQHNRCDFNKKCMDKITVETVSNEMYKQLEMDKLSLPIDILKYME